MKPFNSYRIALLSQEGKFSCVKAAQSLPLISHDYLTRLLIKSDLNCCTELEKLPPNGIIIFDDSVIPKKYSKLIEKCSYVYSSSDNKIVWGLCFILIIYVYKDKIYILDVIMWQKEGPTKNELIREYLKSLKEHNLSPESVLFDKWYNASDTLNLLESFNWKYVTLTKGNRKFNGCYVKEHKYFGTNGKIGKLRRVNHMVQIINTVVGTY